MNRLVASIICLINIILIYPSSTLADPTLWTKQMKEQRDVKITELALAGQKLVFQRDYAQALDFFKDVQKQYPDSSLGYFGEMAIYEVQMLENEDFHLENEFLDASARGMQVYDKVMQKYYPTDKELFYAAGVIGLDSFFQARKGNWWKAYVRGTKSRQIFKRILRKNPQFVDARLGEGMYIYWRSVFTKEYTFLPFFSDRREEGIAIIKGVIDQAEIAQEVARVNLGLIYFEEKNYKDAQKIFENFVQQYPKSVIFYMLLGKVFLASKQYDKALDIFQKTLQLDPEIDKLYYFIGMSVALNKHKNKYDYGKQTLDVFLKKSKQSLWRSYAYYWLGLINEKQGDKTEAKSNYEESIKLNPGLKHAKIKIRGLGGGI
ncbi:MAG: tetratricopeptide repeat protein [Pseudomonadota bacterium]